MYWHWTWRLQALEVEKEMKQILAVSWPGGPISGLGSLQLVDTSHFIMFLKRWSFFLTMFHWKKKKKQHLETLKAVRKWNFCPLLSSLHDFWIT